MINHTPTPPTPAEGGSMSKLSDLEFLEANAHISSSQVRQDIADTRAEINQLQTRRGVSMSVAPRLQVGYAAAVRERKELIADLERLLRLRGEQA